MPSTTSPPIPKHVIIIGGSLSSLMHGIMLHRLGSNVHILEQSPTSTPVSHMAGVCAGSDVLCFLKKFDRLGDVPLGTPSVCLQSVDAQGSISVFLRAERLMTSWDALYFRLRANFDGLKSEYSQSPPQINDGEDGPVAVYNIGKQVTSIEVVGIQVRVIYWDLSAGKSVETLADLVLGADGPNSIVRKTFLGPGIAERRYAGYLAWRGVVPENQVSEETRKLFRANITYSIVKGGHVIVYNIPGELGSIDEGSRLLNFCWYTNQDPSGLADVMTDVDAIHHHTSVPAGKVRASIWARQRELAHSLFIPPYLEVIEKIASPFIHLITDYWSPQASFANGKVLLIGDASALMRPHIAFSTNQAAFQCMLVEKLVKGELSSRTWDWQITRFTYLHWRRSVWFGEYFQRPLYSSLFAAVSYWAAAAVQTARYWSGTMPQAGA